MTAPTEQWVNTLASTGADVMAGKRGQVTLLIVHRIALARINGQAVSSKFDDRARCTQH